MHVIGKGSVPFLIAASKAVIPTTPEGLPTPSEPILEATYGAAMGKGNRPPIPEPQLLEPAQVSLRGPLDTVQYPFSGKSPLLSVFTDCGFIR